MISRSRLLVAGCVVLLLLVAGTSWYILQQSPPPIVIMPHTATNTVPDSSETPVSAPAAVPQTTHNSNSGTIAAEAAPSSANVAAPQTPPSITGFSPASGSPGSTVTIQGENFSQSVNYIYFGATYGWHHPDGTPDDLIATEGSADGTSLTFTVPYTGPSGVLCDTQTHCLAIASTKLQPGKYPVTVSTSAGTTATAYFIVQ